MATPKEVIKSLPHTPGVYIFRDADKTVIYVGKAKDLKKRVSQYFARDDAVGVKTPLLVSQIQSIDTMGTASEFDALLLEAKLIRQYQPKYNAITKDDKSPIYVLLTLHEPLPHIELMRKTNIPKKVYSADALFGPFQSASVLRHLLRDLRATIPYCTQKRRTGTPCFYTHIGLCAPCPSHIVSMPESAEKKRLIKQYRNHIFQLRDLLAGHAQHVLDGLEKEMAQAAEESAFEKAANLRDRIRQLYKLLEKKYDPTSYMTEGFVADAHKQELEMLRSVLTKAFPDIHSLRRIECIDISNTGGAFSTGSLVVLTDGKVDSGMYRRFRIRKKEAPNDTAMIAEVMKRRLAHLEWPYPDLFVIDGGKGQVKIAWETARSLNVVLPIVGLAKRQEEIVYFSGQTQTFRIIRLPLSHEGLRPLMRIRDEAHRFALAYHRLLRKKSFLSGGIV